MKMALQYFREKQNPQPKRTRFIARLSSYHGNTLGSLALGYHKGRRAPYESTLAPSVYHVSQCYPYRDMRANETTEAYVARLADELEAMFQELGPDTVCAFAAETMAGSVSDDHPVYTGERTRADKGSEDSRMRAPSPRIPEGNEGCLR